MLTAASFNTTHQTFIETFNQLDFDNGCEPTVNITPADVQGPADLSGRVNYILGSLAPGQSVNVLFRYTLV
jgi:hypothetical protein